MKISNMRLGIGLPLSYHMVPASFLDSFVTLEKPPFIYMRASSGSIDEMRNELVRDAIQSNCTHLLLMDTDQTYHPKTIERLMAHQKLVVGCLVFRRYPPFDPLMLRGEIGNYKTVSEWEPGSLVEVDATGTGCILYDMKVFREMPMPWFRSRKDPETDKPIGEDIGFCSDLRKAGYEIFVDTSTPAGHLSQFIITEGTWNLYRTLSDAEAKAKHREEHGILVTKPPQKEEVK